MILDSLAPFSKLFASFIFLLIVVVVRHLLLSCSSETALILLAILICSSIILLNVFFIFLGCGPFVIVHRVVVVLFFRNSIDSLAPFAKLFASFVFLLMLVLASHRLLSCSSETALILPTILICSQSILLNVFFIFSGCGPFAIVCRVVVVLSFRNSIDSLAPFAKLFASFVFLLMLVLASHRLLSCSSETALILPTILICSQSILLNVFFVFSGCGPFAIVRRVVVVLSFLNILLPIPIS